MKTHVCVGEVAVILRQLQKIESQNSWKIAVRAAVVVIVGELLLTVPVQSPELEQSIRSVVPQAWGLVGAEPQPGSRQACAAGTAGTCREVSGR
eukprot:COSAG05_NODE_649_length_8102_cov_157.470823_5_plen_94_part_00